MLNLYRSLFGPTSYYGCHTFGSITILVRNRPPEVYRQIVNKQVEVLDTNKENKKYFDSIVPTKVIFSLFRGIRVVVSEQLQVQNSHKSPGNYHLNEPLVK